MATANKCPAKNVTDDDIQKEAQNILNIRNTPEAAQAKKLVNKMKLKLHPDKNPACVDLAKEKLYTFNNLIDPPPPPSAPDSSFAIVGNAFVLVFFGLIVGMGGATRLGLGCLSLAGALLLYAKLYTDEATLREVVTSPNMHTTMWFATIFGTLFGAYVRVLGWAWGSGLATFTIALYYGVQSAASTIRATN